MRKLRVIDSDKNNPDIVSDWMTPDEMVSLMLTYLNEYVPGGRFEVEDNLAGVIEED